VPLLRVNLRQAYWSSSALSSNHPDDPVSPAYTSKIIPRFAAAAELAVLPHGNYGGDAGREKTQLRNRIREFTSCVNLPPAGYSSPASAVTVFLPDEGHEATLFVGALMGLLSFTLYAIVLDLECISRCRNNPIRCGDPGMSISLNSFVPSSNSIHNSMNGEVLYSAISCRKWTTCFPPGNCRHWSS